MTTSKRMEEEQSLVTEKIIKLTLEIIYLLSREVYPFVKSGDQVTTMVSSSHSQASNKNKVKKILELTNKITELLNGESAKESGDNIVIKEEYIEEDEEYGVIEESSKEEPPYNRNPPERRPCPLYSQHSIQEGHIIPHHGQGREEIKQENDEDGVMESAFSKEHKDLYKENTVESSMSRNPPERCPHPLYSQNLTLEDLTITQHDQGEDLINTKVENEVEETYVRHDQQHTEEAGMTRIFIEEDNPIHIGIGHTMEEPIKEHLPLPPNFKIENEDITRDCSGEYAMSSAMVNGLHSEDRPWIPSDSDSPCTVSDGFGIQEEGTFSCAQCGERFVRKYHLMIHQRTHAKKIVHACSVCGKCFVWKSDLARHQVCHTGEKPYSCSWCGKCFSQKPHLAGHERTHTGEKPYCCSECGKCFSNKRSLNTHQRYHII